MLLDWGVEREDGSLQLQFCAGNSFQSHRISSDDWISMRLETMAPLRALSWLLSSCSLKMTSAPRVTSCLFIICYILDLRGLSQCAAVIVFLMYTSPSQLKLIPHFDWRTSLISAGFPRFSWNVFRFCISGAVDTNPLSLAALVCMCTPCIHLWGPFIVLRPTS